MIVRVPLASGLLSGKYTRETTFAADDHRNFNRHGEAFDVGETFAGVPFEVGLEAVDELRPLVPDGATLAQFALRWILMHDAVSTVIPGARSPEQARANAAAADAPGARRATHGGRSATVYERRDRAARAPALVARADDGPRTRDLWLGKPTLYQLSYVRGRRKPRPILARIYGSARLCGERSPPSRSPSICVLVALRRAARLRARSERARPRRGQRARAR